MAGPEQHWWDLWREWVIGVLATVTTTAAGAMGLMFREHRKQTAMVHEHHKYIRRLKRRGVLAATAEHERKLKDFDSKLSATSKLADVLDDQTKSLTSVANSLQGSIINLTTLVEKRGKEHHELRDLLQPIAMRITVLETRLDRDDGK